MDLLQSFEMTPATEAKRLNDHFGELLVKSDTEIEKGLTDFLKVLATYVFRSFSQRRKDGVPMGYLGKFVYPESTKINLTQTMMLHIVKILRKRGLRESIAAKKSAVFDQLESAYERAAQRR